MEYWPVYRVRCELLGEHVHMTFFERQFGQPNFRNLGKLVGSIGDYQVLLAAIALGFEQMKGRYKLETVGWSPDPTKNEQKEDGR